ncbi:MAG: ATPase domain-containing protein, partial [Candidatus Thorarchaeota archaeon]|nr:ATPase domain-containing protein [Candidatus Thorarchaeota archaeon]
MQKLRYRDRCNTGIPELDTMLTGGIPRGRTILIEGPPGAGK